MNKKAVIFDFDGVILESEKSGFDALREILKTNHQIEVPKSDFSKKLGLSTLAYISKYFGDKLNQEQIEEIYNKYKKNFSHDFDQHVTFHYEVINFIKENSKKYRFVIASMNTKDFINRVLDHLDMANHIEFIITREDVEKHKPDPEIYLRALQELDIDHSQAIVVEDSIVGVQAGISANIDTVAIINELSTKEMFVDIDVIAEINVETFNKDIQEILSR